MMQLYKVIKYDYMVIYDTLGTFRIFQSWNFENFTPK